MAATPESQPAVPVDFGLRLQRPVVVALIGLPGAGKTLVAEHLRQRLQVRVVNRDHIRRALFPECAYSQPEKRASVHAAFLAVEVNAALGESTVVDGMTFSKTSDLNKLGELVARYGMGFVPIWLDVSADLARQRIQADIDSGAAHLAEDRVPEMVDSILAGFQKPAPTVPVIDASLPAARVRELAEKIVLARAGRGRA
jgi:predicted kinase